MPGPKIILALCLICYVSSGSRAQQPPRAKPASDASRAPQPVPPPPKPADDGPSLQVTMKFIQEKLSERGPITYSETKTDPHSVLAPWTTTWTDELTNVVADSQRCTISYHYHFSSGAEDAKPLDEDETLTLKEVKKITVRPLAEQLNEMFEGKLTVTIRSPIFQVTVQHGHKGGGSFIVDDEELANRLARAINHAVELCTPDKKTEPF